MTVFQKRVYAGLPYQVKIKKARYYDYSFAGRVFEDTTKDIELTPYDGMSYTVNPNYRNGTTSTTSWNRSISINVSMLPDYSDGFQEEYTYGVGSSNKYIERDEYTNFSKRGTPTISNTGIMSNITNGDNIYTTFNPAGKTWEIYFHIVTPATFTDQAYIFGNYSTNRATPQVCTDSEGHLMIYLASTTGSWDIANGVTSTQKLNKNAEYLIKTSWNGSAYKVEVLPQPLYFQTPWTEYIVIQSTTPVYSTTGQQFCIGYDSGNSAWNGKIKLADSYIKIGDKDIWRARVLEGHIFAGVTYWKPLTKANLFYSKDQHRCWISDSEEMEGYVWLGEINLPKYGGYMKFNTSVSGNVRIVSRWASNFATYNYFSIYPEYSDFGEEFSIVARVKTGQDSNTRNIVFDESANNHGYGTYSSKRWRIWNGANNAGGSFEYNTIYWTKFVQTANNSKLYVMEDVGTYTIDTLPDIDDSAWGLMVEINTPTFAGNQFRVGNGYVTTSEYWNGEIDLDSFRIYYGDNQVWQFFEIVGA